MTGQRHQDQQTTQSIEDVTTGNQQRVERHEFLKKAGTVAGAGLALPYALDLMGGQPALARSADAASRLPKFEGAISFYAQAYTPQHPTKSNPHPPTKLFEVAASYEKLHPNVKINFLPSNLGGTNYPG